MEKDNQGWYVVETLEYKSRHYTYGDAVAQAASMSEITGFPSLIFKTVSIVNVINKTTTIRQYHDPDPTL